jgi:hypothetical protein
MRLCTLGQGLNQVARDQPADEIKRLGPAANVPEKSHERSFG